MNLGLELHYEKASFIEKESGKEIVYNRYYVLLQNVYSGELEKIYLTAKDSSKYALGQIVKKLEQNK